MFESNSQPLRSRPREILPLLPLGAIAGALIGAALSALNAWLTFYEFAPRMRVPMPEILDIESTLRHNMVRDGFTLGAKTGLLLSLILIVAIYGISKLRCPFRLAAAVGLRVIKFTLLFWLAGGINLMILAALAPDKVSGIINPLPAIFLHYGSHQNVTPDFLRDAWVWGSIRGFRVGLVLATVGCLVSFAAKWRQIERECRVASV